MSNVSTLVDRLGALGQQSKELYEKYKGIEEQKVEVRQQLQELLAAVGLQSAKTTDFTASVASKPTVLVTNEQSVIDWLKQTPDVETDQYIGLKRTEFKSLATTILKQTGEVIPGTEVLLQNTLSIRKNKEKK